ncbi:MAG: hypothetical protein M3445_07655 [Actinomycetota bacterium]|nr:hypothetical protein [Actinomycetota bacterium]
MVDPTPAALARAVLGSVATTRSHPQAMQAVGTRRAATERLGTPEPHELPALWWARAAAGRGVSPTRAPTRPIGRPAARGRRTGTELPPGDLRDGAHRRRVRCRVRGVSPLLALYGPTPAYATVLDVEG